MMKQVLLLCLVLLCALIRADEAAAEPATEGPSDVLTLDAASFANAIKDNPILAVEFYAPWCGHCKALAPEWEKAATELKGKVAVAKVDCIESPDLCQEHGVQGYPTLKLFREGEPAPMEVARKAEAIVDFLTRELAPPVTILTTAQAVEDFVKEHPLTAFAILDNDHDDRWATFKSVALQKRHMLSFAAAVSSDWAGHSAPALVVYRNFEEPKIVYSGEFTAPAMSQWISKSLLPLLGEINADTFQSYMAADLKLIGYLFVDPSDASTTAFLKELEPKLVPYKDDFRVAWINNNKYAQQAQRLGLSNKIPSLALDNHNDGVRYVFPDDKTMTAESLGEWLAEYQAGTLKPFVKSEPVPESNDEAVKVLVAHTFKDIVYDSSKDVMVEFYAPWCGHCKSLAPVWTQLGEALKSIPSVVIAKIDATANDVPPKLNIRGFPTILYFPANHKDPFVEYQGSRSLDDLAKFVHTHADVKFDLPAAALQVPEAQEEEEEEDEHAGHHHEKDEL